MEIIKTTKTTKTIEVTESICTYQDEILYVEKVDYDKVCLVCKNNRYEYSLCGINLMLAHCNDDIRLLFHIKFLNADELNSFLTGAVITIDDISVHFEGYGYTNDSKRIVDVKLREKVIDIIHNAISEYISKVGHY